MEKKKAGRPKSAEPKNVNVGLRMTGAQYERLKAFAETNGKTVSKTVLEASSRSSTGTTNSWN